MSLSEVMSSLKYAINSSIGTPDFKTLDQLIKGQNVDLSGVADKSTLDSLVLKVGNTDDLGGGYQTGSISAKLNNVINSISSINTNVNNIKTVTDTINANVNAVANKIPGGLQATLGAINTHAGDANTNAYNASVKADTIINTLNTMSSNTNKRKVKVYVATNYVRLYKSSVSIIPKDGAGMSSTTDFTLSSTVTGSSIQTHYVPKLYFKTSFNTYVDYGNVSEHYRIFVDGDFNGTFNINNNQYNMTENNGVKNYYLGSTYSGNNIYGIVYFEHPYGGNGTSSVNFSCDVRGIVRVYAFSLI